MGKSDHAPSDTPVAATSPLARWKAQHAALGRLIESYEEAGRLGVLDSTDVTVALTGVGAVGAVGTLGASVELPVGAFLNMSIPEAIKLYLSAIKKKQTVREIAVALKEGGMETTAANWENAVTGALHRLKAAGTVLRFKDGWGLADFYPESLRGRIAKEEKPRKTRTKKARPAGRVAKATAQAPRRAIHLGPGSFDADEKAG